MRKRKIWMKWYPSDWRADPLLRACDPLSRYVWMEMIGLMHEAEPYGHLLLNGKKIDDQTLAGLIGVPLKSLRTALRELGDMGVYSVTDGDEIIFSRRMVRDEMKATSARDHGHLGGNPALKNQALKDSEDKGSLKGGVKAQRLEARDQSLEEETPTGVSSVNGPEKASDLGGLLPTTAAVSPSRKSGKKQARGEPKIPWPDGFDLDGEMHRYATDAGIAFEAVHDLWERFRAHHVKNGSRWAGERGWRAAWQGWVRNEIKFDKERREKNGGGRPARAAYDPIEYARQRIEQLNATEEEATFWPKN